jgi:acyl transferase domain-containing protein
VDIKPGLMPPSASLDPRGRRFVRRRTSAPLSASARPVFLFAGLGSEHPAMGRGLFRMSTTFRHELERCDRLYRALTGRPLLVRSHLPFGARIASGRPSYVQPAVFAFQYALAATLMSWGVRPAAVLGYSLGEDAAACVAGVASLDDVFTLVVNRARHMDRLRGGGMAVLFADVDHARALTANHGVDIAAANGPDHTVVSGTRAGIDAVLAAAARGHVRGRRIRTGCAFHSSLMDRVLPQLARDAAAMSLHKPSTPLISSVTADWVSRATLADPAYWSGRVRAPIRFRDGIARLYAEGFRTFIEIGAHPMLVPILKRDAAIADVTCIETARRGEDDAVVTMAALARLPRPGASLAAYAPPARARRVADVDVRPASRRAAEILR